MRWSIRERCLAMDWSAICCGRSSVNVTTLRRTPSPRIDSESLTEPILRRKYDASRRAGLVLPRSFSYSLVT
jgi:hypothetical protein